MAASEVKTSAFHVQSTIKHDGKIFRKGPDDKPTVIRLGAKEADHLLKTGAIKPAE
jgi:hypothetical protein